MLFNVLATVIVLLLTYVYVRWVILKQYWAKRGIPHMPPNPLCGNLTFLLRESNAVWFRRIYNTFKEPYVGIWVFWRPGLVVNSPDVAKNILIKDQANFRNRFATSGTSDPLGRLNLFTLDDPLWTVLKKRLTVLFTSSKLRGVQTIMIQKSKALIERIEMERKKLAPIDTRNIMTDYSTDIIGTSSFGVVSDATLNGTSSIKDITAALMHVDLFRGLAWCCGFFIPELADFFRITLYPPECAKNMREMLRAVIEQRGGLENKVTDPRDLLDILIKLKQEGSEELDMSEDMMVAQAAVFVQGGFDTTATAMAFIIYELAFDPEVQDKLYKELQEAKEKCGDDLLGTGDLSQLNYLNCVIYEGLRKYPIIGYLDRVALNDYKVDDRLTIKAGTPVYVNLVGMHSDPEFYPEPEKFNPDRFLPENKSDINPSPFLAFGEGPRKCIGQRFGLSSIRYGLTAVFLNYEVRPVPNAPQPKDISLDKKSLLVAPGEILSVNFVPRKNN